MKLRDRFLDNIVGITAAVALMAGVAICIAATFRFGEAMFQNLLAGLAGTLLTIGITILGLDWIVRVERKKKWQAGYEALAGLLAQTYIDVMRLFYVRFSSAGFDANIDRYDEFKKRGAMNLAGTSGILTALATILEPELFLAARQIEQRLRWALNRMDSTPKQKQHILTDVYEVMRVTATSTDRFLAMAAPEVYQRAKKEAQVALRSEDPSTTAGGLLNSDAAFRWRWDAQASFLDGRSDGMALRTIANDVDNEAAFGYFVVDEGILARGIAN